MKTVQPNLRPALLVSTGLAMAITAMLPATAAAQTAVLAMAASNADQDEGRITGRVTTTDGTYLRGAEIRVQGTETVAVTDSDGRFTLARVPLGEQQIVVSYFGYETYRATVTVTAGSSQDLAIQLRSGARTADGTIVVTGTRPIAESEEAAIQYKRASTSLVDVIAADSIGRFPDQNIAAAISRMPGVSVGRDQGQERYISLRGSPSYWTTLAFDGVNVISPNGRNARFDTIPSAIASKVVIKKAVTPDMPGETVAGNVDVVTRSPFDYPGFKISGDLAYGLNDLGDGNQYNFSGFVSDKFANDTFGILIGASYYKREMVTDNYETDWEVAGEDDAPGGDQRLWAKEYTNKLYRLNRYNKSVSGRLEWQPDTDNSVFLSSIWTQFRDDELRNAYVFDLDQDAVDVSDPTRARTGYADAGMGNGEFNGTLYGVEVASSLNNNSTKQTIFTNTLGGDHDLESWRVKWRLNYTRADDRGNDPFKSGWIAGKDPTERLGLVYDMSNPDFYNVELHRTVVNDDGSYALGDRVDFLGDNYLKFEDVSHDYSLERTKAYTAKFDIEHDIALFGADTVLKFGGEYDRRTKKAHEYAYMVEAEDLIDAGIAVPTMADIALDTDYKGEMPIGYDWDYFSGSKSADLMQSYRDRGVAYLEEDASEENDYKVTEEIFAGYLMGTSYFDWGNIVYGARVEHIKNTGNALARADDSWVPVSMSANDFRVYPSLHVNWDVTSDVKARLSFNTGAARPDYDEIRPNFTYDDDEMMIEGGNPDATPETAKGVDAYVEWYMPSRGFFSVGAYYKWLDDILYDVQLTSFGSDVMNSNGVDRSEYSFATIDNGGSGSIKGIEFAYVQPLESLLEDAGLPDWMLGFGFRGNLTINDSTAEAPDGRNTDLPGASPLIYNVSGYYERYGLSLRLSYQWQDAYLDSIGDNEVVGDDYWASVSRLDASIRYSVSDNLQLYFDANNLTNEPGIRYQGNGRHVKEHETFGTRYMGGIRFNF
ncbi:TonB-dependent receptor [Altericroceibacterium spongiae]|uniref:TonB-dependent receptor n=1 Tax=Altericroceibacterium spongiae TaxID=2320269 RepID=A0A420ER02_9SPHN|nr:TonB-dependent receptor [Altericroceibacterium spongiae]RKF23107.1 TonB-dependent receptor [Altericroceibacterium spongiae]